MDKKPNLLIVTGLSGAGMSSALKDLEDLGYEVFDNFPPSLVDPLLAEEDSRRRAIAIGIDTRARGFDPAEILAMVERLDAKLIFITAEDSVLQRRFTETRRKHPLAKDRPVSAGIRRELELLHGLRKEADLVIDTSELSVHDLRRLLEGHFSLTGQDNLSLTLMSFGFRYGLPREADIVLDVRFLKNPHWEEDLRPLTGRDRAVGDYIERDENYAGFIERFRAMLDPLLPLYRREGKQYLTVALGCTGGRHRSVYTVEKLAAEISDRALTVNIVHRDVDR